MDFKRIVLGTTLVVASVGAAAGMLHFIGSSTETAFTDAPKKLEIHSDLFEDPGAASIIDHDDALNALLSRTGLSSKIQEEVAHALMAQYETSRISQNDRLGLQFRPGGTLYRATLEIDGDTQVEISLDGAIDSQAFSPADSTVNRSNRLLLDGTIKESLDRAGVPARFYVDLAFVLGDAVNFQDDFSGSESLNILWRQPKGLNAQPQLSFAALELADDEIEVVWSEEDNARATVYLNGDVVRRTEPPAEGIRVSSVFGRTTNPMYGLAGMHTGYDYLAAKGTPVIATAPGLVSFIGWRSGYGKVVELAHGSEVMTRYAHLSSESERLELGKRVQTGEMIGMIGETGTVSGPTLHFEVRAN